jgi:hypothetical protein
MSLGREPFLLICSEITGYSAVELESTGVVDTYCQLLPKILGPQLTQELATAVAAVLSTRPDTAARQAALAAALRPPSRLWPVIAGLASLWYLGTWNQLPDSWYQAVALPRPGPQDAGRTHVPSQLAYIEQLSYRTAFAHAPGANPTGFNSWSQPPVQV